MKSREIALAAIVVVAALAGFIASGAAQEKAWKHGLINAKADAGIFLMVSTRDFAKKQGLKIEISQFKDDQLALKALIAGELRMVTRYLTSGRCEATTSLSTILLTAASSFGSL